MTTLIKATVLEPFITGPLLYVLTKGSPELRERILRPLASLPFTISAATLVTALKWLVAAGVARRFNDFMNKLAFNGWTFNNGGRAWDWENELCVITGGSGGLGSIVVRHLLQKGVRVAIMDVSPPPPSLQSCKNA